MAVQVFLSHTQRDEDFCNIFETSCARVGIKSFRSEFEKIELPAWQTIRDAIRKSRALVLLIGRELARAQASPDPLWEYTQNWIAFEIGVACERGIDVWVVCDDVPINFPVPYLNNYLPVSLRHKEAYDYFVEVLMIYTRGRKTTFPDERYVTQCPYKQDCKAIYNLPVQLPPGGTIICPQCLREVVFPEGFLQGV